MSTVDIAIGVVKKNTGNTTIINENNVELESRVISLENAQGIKTAATAKVFVVWNGTGYQYTVTYPLYYINGVAFPAGEKVITLTESDDTLDRTDTFGLNAQGAFAVPGVPALEPVAPTVDNANEIFVTTILVKANTVVPEPDPNPTPVANIVVYRENIEWQTSSVSAGTNFNFASAVFQGSKCIRMLAIIKFRDTVNVYNAQQFEALRLKILQNYQGSGHSGFSFRLLLNDTVVSSTETLYSSIDYPAGKNPAVYETVLLDFKKFSFTSSNFNAIEIIPIRAARFTGSSLIDDIVLLAKSIHVGGSNDSTIDTSYFVTKTSYGLQEVEATGVVTDLLIDGNANRGIAFTATATELRSIIFRYHNPMMYDGMDWFFKNDQETDIIIKHQALAIADKRFVPTTPNGEDILVKPNETIHFKAKFTLFYGGKLEFVGKVVDLGNLIATAEEKETIHDDDAIGIADSEDNNKTKLWKFSTVKSTLLQYFQSLFQSKEAQILISSSTTVQNSWGGKTVYFTANCTITVPSTLDGNFMDFGFRTMPGVTVTWAITAPFTWETTPDTTPEKTDGLFTRYNGGNTIILRW